MEAVIKEGQEFHMSNVLSFRKKMSMVELQQESMQISRFIESGGFAKAGPTVTATFAIEQQGGTTPDKQVLDMELLIPLDKPFTPPDSCVCKPEFRLVNAVSIRHMGNPATLQESCNKLMAYVEEHGLQPITCGYNVTVQEAKTQAEMDQMIVDVYIGISPNIL